MTVESSDQPPEDQDVPSAADLAEEIRALRGEIRVLRKEIRRLQARLGDAPGVSKAEAAGLLPRTINGLTSRAARAAAWWAAFRARRRVEWSPGGVRWDALALTVIVILAAVLRLMDLATVPLGMQGDEAATGLEARRILADGWIGVYSPVAAGNPTGFYYLAAASTAVFGESIFAVRITAAVVGILTVAALYVLLRRNLGYISAVAGTTFLATSLWHIIFSRIAHVTNTWPLVMVLAAIPLMEGLRSWRWYWWAAAGAMLALGMYLYNGHMLVLAVVGIFVVAHLFGWSGLLAAAGLVAAIYLPGPPTFVIVLLTTALFAMSPEIRSKTRLTAAAAFGSAFLLVAYPMAKFIASRQDEYFGRSEQLSLFNSEEWAERTDRVDQVRFLASRYVDSWDKFSFNPVPSVVDITGVVPIIPPSALLLCLIGLALGLARRFGPLVQLGALIVLVMPLAPAVFVDVAMRRALVIAPFLAMFAGIAVAEILSIARRRGWGTRIGSVVGLVLVLALITYRTGDGFYTTMDSPTERWTLGPELVEASRYMDELAPETYVYFFSHRWPFHYEVIRYLAPDVRGETRGEPYGPDSIEIDPAKGQPVFVLLGEYQVRLPEIQARYPGGTVIEGPPQTDPSTGPSYIVYVLPPIPEMQADEQGDALPTN